VPDPESRIELTPYSFAAALALERELGVGHVLAQVLVRRGFGDPDAARAFLHRGVTHDPRGFDGLEAAVALIRRHLDARTRIVVHGDYDVDGVCATAILVRGLRAMGADVSWFLPSRVDDGYGLARSTVDALAARGTELLITVDCAITAIEEVAAARAAGIDVVVTDHHSPRADGQLPDAPIVHPALCGYPCAELCGTGVAYKLAQALGAPGVEGDLELVAIATIADLMGLTGENRTLVRDGLRALAVTARPGLRALMAVSRVDPSAVDTSAVGFRLAPRINAAGRLQRADAGVELLLTADHARAKEIAAELDSVNAERRMVEQRIVWEAVEQVAALGERRGYVLAAEGWHPGVIGIVASRIVERFHRPAVLVGLDGELGSGSGRSIPGFDLLGALHACAGQLERYGGHRAAAGLTVARGRLDAFRAEFEAHCAAHVTDEMLAPVERVDAVVSGSELTIGLADELALLEPCGIGNPAPRVLIPGARFTEVRAMGEGKHARFVVRSGEGHARAVAFGCGGKLPAEPVDASFRLERNVWNGAVEPRAVLRIARPCARGEIEVVGQPANYLLAAFDEVEQALGEQPGGADNVRRLCRSNERPLDRRGESPLAVLADAVATGEPVLAVCAEVARRLAGLRSRTGGFALCAYAALERSPALAAAYGQVVALDPPVGAQARDALRAAPVAHLAWGAAELRFAEQMHELEYGLRTSLTAIYRSLRARGAAAGEELERLLRGDGSHGRTASCAGRCIRVLAELQLVSLSRANLSMTIGSTAPTALERSPAYNEYNRRYEDGRRYLSSATPRRKAA
jgi:single-stranded-DNA-specific exonuclease